MIRPKITIFKMLIISNEGHYRNYSPYTTDKNNKQKVPTFDLNDTPSKYPNISYIKTERELCEFLYKSFGSGFYRVVAHLKGKEGAYTFWRGEITNQGFIFARRPISRDIDKLQKKIAKSQDTEEKNELKNDLELEKEIEGEIKKGTRYGFYPFLTPSARRGTFSFWNDGELSKEEAEKEFEKWNNPMQINETKKFEDWGEIKKIKEKDFEKWG